MRWRAGPTICRCGKIFGWLFSPAAFLMGVDAEDVGKVGSLLGAKLAINEHFAYLQMKELKADPGIR